MTVFKGVVIFALGFGFGVIGANMALKDSFEERVQEELDRVEMANQVKEYRNIPSDEADGSVTGQVGKLKLMQKEYTGIARRYDTQQEDPEEEASNSNGDINPYPYIITTQAFSFECEDHEKEILYYYGQDGVLCDDNQDLVGNWMELVGNVASYFDLTDGNHSESHAVYVRNERMQTDYEIIFLDKEYSTVVGEEK
jgi:hypothetical protein